MASIPGRRWIPTFGSMLVILAFSPSVSRLGFKFITGKLRRRVSVRGHGKQVVACGQFQERDAAGTAGEIELVVGSAAAKVFPEVGMVPPRNVRGEDFHELLHLGDGQVRAEHAVVPRGGWTLIPVGDPDGDLGYYHPHRQRQVVDVRNVVVDDLFDLRSRHVGCPVHLQRVPERPFRQLPGGIGPEILAGPQRGTT